MKLDDDIAFLYMLRHHTMSWKFIHSRNRHRFYNLLSKVEKRKRHRRIPRVSLHYPHESAWRKLYNSKVDQSLITFTGLDVKSFEDLLELFTPVYESFYPDSDGNVYHMKKNVNKGRKRIISAKDCLGLVLAWTRTRGSKMCLQMIFGMTGTCVSRYLEFGSRILVKLLQELDEARVHIPSIDYIEEMKELVREKYSMLENVWCTMDGLKLMLECSSDEDEQNNYYNGWTGDHYVNAVLGFCPDGTIRVCCYNVPGSVHDSTIAELGGIYDKLGKVFTSCDGKCTVDSAFARNKYPFLIKSGKNNLDLNRSERIIRQQATSMRQSAEWGMRAFQSSFPRIKDRIRWEEYGKRKHMVKMMILLFNYRTNKVGINQILNFYKPNLDRDANEMLLG